MNTNTEFKGFRYAPWVLLSVAIVMASSQPCFAQRHVDADDLVQFSLNSLKESARTAALDNEQLRQNILQLEQNIKEAKRHQIVVESTKEQAAQSADKIKASIATNQQEESLIHQGKERIDEALIRLTYEHKTLEEQLAAKDKDGQAFEQKVDALTGAIQELSAQATDVGQQIEARKNVDIRRQLEEELQSYRKKVSDLQKQYTYWQRKIEKPLSLLDGLKEENSQIEERVAKLQESLSLAQEREKKAQEDILALEEKSKEDLIALNVNIQALKQRNEELDQVLTQAKLKINQKNVDLSKYSALPESLTENLSIVKEENTELKEKYSSLQNVYGNFVQN